MKTSPEVNEDWYAFVERPSSLLYGVKIKKGKYEGVIVTYGKVSLREDSGVLRLNFQYKIEESSKHNIKKLEGSDEFRNLLGDVLSHIIQTSTNNGTAKIGENADPRTLQAKKYVTESPTDDPSEAGQ
jgi:hypothetical protein